MQINEANFKDYFFRADEKYKPEKGQVLARWRTSADFVDGWVKRNIIQLLCSHESGAESSHRIMTKLVSAVNKDAVRVLREMTEDLIGGMSVDEVCEKPYRFVVEQFYWTQKEYVPDDVHWDLISCVDVRNVDSKILGLSETGENDNIEGICFSDLKQENQDEAVPSA